MENKKIFIVGAQCSGKISLSTILKNEYKYKVGTFKTDYPLDLVYKEPIYNTDLYSYLSRESMQNIFDLQYNVFMKNIPNTLNQYFEALTLNDYADNNVFVLSIDQFVNIPINKLMNDDTLVIWLDNTKTKRIHVYNNEYRTYGFKKRELVEQSNMSIFIEYINKIQNKIYFLNECPDRVAYISNNWIKNKAERKTINKIFN